MTRRYREPRAESQDVWSLVIVPTIGAMGFNPFRKQTTSRLDIALVVGAIGIAVALVLWAVVWP